MRRTAAIAAAVVVAIGTMGGAQAQKSKTSARKTGTKPSVKKPAAAIKPKPQPKPSPWLVLFNGKDTAGWVLRHEGTNRWKVEQSELWNTGPGTDLATVRKFGDCELHIEFMVPKNGNSGVYLQGRYEVQVCDSAGQTPGPGTCGSVYSKITASKDASLPADQWQTLDVSFRQARLDSDGKVAEKARITVIMNDEMIIDNQEIDGVTGGAMDANEGKPGPLMLQGDHTAIRYRNIRIHPLETPEGAEPTGPGSGKDR